MGTSKSNLHYARRNNEYLRIPTTKKEFEELSYLDRVQLKEEHPAIYEKLAGADEII